jgi:hypothetical protein
MRLPFCRHIDGGTPNAPRTPAANRSATADRGATTDRSPTARSCSNPAPTVLLNRRARLLEHGVVERQRGLEPVINRVGQHRPPLQIGFKSLVLLRISHVPGS